MRNKPGLRTKGVLKDEGGSNARMAILFWGVLALVVIGLLVVVAKLLPKPPAPTA